MSEDTKQPIEILFENLDKWRHFAGFPLEARVDAMIGLFLPRILERHFKIEMCKQVIPQFPLRQEGDNRSDKVDFLALSECGTQAFLIEIKTDMTSIRDRQIKYLKRAKTEGMYQVLCGLKKIASANTRNRKKYLHLLYALCELGFIELTDELKSKILNGETTDTSELIKQIDPCNSSETKLKVVYVQPKKHRDDKKHGFCHIYFDEVSKSVEGQGDIGNQLACYLPKWKEAPGLRSPENS